MEGILMIIVLVFVFSVSQSANKAKKRTEKERQKRAYEEVRRQTQQAPAERFVYSSPESDTKEDLRRKTAQLVAEAQAEEDLRQARQRAKEKLEQKHAKEAQQSQQQKAHKQSKQVSFEEALRAHDAEKKARAAQRAVQNAATAAFASVPEGTDSLGGAKTDQEGKCAVDHNHGGNAAVAASLRFGGITGASTLQQSTRTRFSDNEVVNGIIWNEVLSGPVSRRAGRRP